MARDIWRAAQKRASHGGNDYEAEFYTSIDCEENLHRLRKFS